MNDLEKHSFYSFLVLYLTSSLFFVLVSSYWYYSSLKSSLESKTYYKLTHLADTISGQIINAQMKGVKLQLPSEEGYEYVLVPVDDKNTYNIGYYEKNAHKVLVSASPQEHLNIAFVVVKTQKYFEELKRLKNDVVTGAGVVLIAIFIISFFLAKLFMKPVHKRIEQIEEFIQDVSHELNTPITALKMSASRAIKKEVYDKKILTNISISTKQLETIYNSLTYLNFSDKQENITQVAFDDVVRRVVNYYSELSNAKGIHIETDIEAVSFDMIESRAELLISNLLSNAIKYSMPQSKIHIGLKEGVFVIKDEGVGIAKEKLDTIFELYSRDSNIAGGFGVGLNIVKQICDTYKIKVEVSSILGEGSEFRLLF